MTGPEDAPAVPARPDEQAVAEALRYFREHPERLRWIRTLVGPDGEAQKHAVTLARAALAAGPARRTDVGRCGDRPVNPIRGCTTLATICELDAGHAGWHRDGMTEWGRVGDYLTVETASPLPTGTAHQPDGEGGGTGDGTSTETHVEYRVLALHQSTGEVIPVTVEPDPQARAEDRAQACRDAGFSQVRVESRTVTTTRTETPWKAEQR